MKKLVLLFCAALILSSCSMGDNDVLWGKAKSGMTVSQIKSLYPNVTEDDKFSFYFWLKHVDVADVTSNVKFIFIDGKLSSVDISPAFIKIRGAEYVIKKYYSELVEKYGSPVRPGNEDLKNGTFDFSSSSGVKKEVLSWGFNNTVITFMYSVNDGVANYVDINYTLMAQKVDL